MRMRTLSREAVPVTAAVAACVLPFTALWDVNGRPGSALAVPVASRTASLLPTALTALAALATMGLPPAFLLIGAIVAGHGLGIAALQEPVVGPLLISDALLLAYLLRALTQPRTKEAAVRDPVCWWLGLFLAWSFLATAYVGAPLPPLLRISVYGAVFILLSNRGTDRRLMYGSVLCYALVNVVGGVLDGQTRLVGLDIGDPAQTGALLLAALCPLLTSEMRFTGRWAVGAVLLFGIFLTQTRSAWFATIVVLVVWAQKKLSLVRIVVILSALAWLGLKTVGLITQWFGLNPTSGDLRALSIANGIRTGMERPLFGAGWGRVPSMDVFGTSFSEAVDQVLPYNLIVCVFASVGLPAVLLLLLFLGGLLRRLIPRRGTPLLFTVGVLAMSLAEMTLYAGSMLTVLFFTYAGMGLGPERPRADGIPEQQPGGGVDRTRSGRAWAAS